MPARMVRHALLAAGMTLVALAGCQKQEGPAERAGKQIDQTVEQVGQEVRKAGEAIEDAARSKDR